MQNIIFLFAPIGVFYYPLSILPRFLQVISYMLPVTYVNEAARHQLVEGIVKWDFLLIATVLNSIYFVVSYWFIRKMFQKTKQTGGFARLEG